MYPDPEDDFEYDPFVVYFNAPSTSKYHLFHLSQLKNASQILKV